MQLVGAPLGARDFYFNRYLPHTATDPDDRKKGARMVLLKIKALPSPFEQSAWLRELSMVTGSTEHVLHAEMERLPASLGFKSPLVVAPSPVLRGTRKDLITERIVQLGGRAELILAIPDYTNPSADGSSAHGALADFKAEWETHEITDSDRTAEVTSLIIELKKELCKERIAKLKAVIFAAQATHDEPALAAALKEFDNVSQELHTIPDGKRKS